MTPGAAEILVVEDDAVMRVTLADILEEQGYQVIGCQSGIEGAQLIKQSPPDVVIADLRLPDLNGLQLLETLKEIKPEAAFILITGHASLETAVAALNDGAFAYVTKPFNIDEVCTEVDPEIRTGG
jgi:two-component system response regulator PilR (NtrC family)